VLLACIASSCSGDETHAPARRVILVTCDTLRADRLGTYGYALPTSPNIDDFARHCVVFDDAYTTAPWTVPALAALHTGKLPDELGVVGGNRAPLPREAVTLAELAREGGYGTAAFVSNWVLRRPDPKLEGAGFQEGFETFDDEMTSKDPKRIHYERLAPDTTAAAVRWLDQRQRAGGDRFFLWVHYQDPHGPYRPPAGLMKKLERPMTDEPLLPIGKNTRGLRQIPAYQVLDGEARPEAYRLRYDAEIASFDAGFGDFLAALRRLNWFDDSLIVLTADHGESLGEHGYWFCHGENVYREEVRVPLAIHFPRGALHVAGRPSSAGERVGDLVDHLDLWPTILEALGLPARENRGTSLFRAKLPQDRLSLQTFARPSSPKRWQALGDGEYRLVMAPRVVNGAATGTVTQLFDIARDPGELHDIARDEPERVARLMNRLSAYFESHKSTPLAEIDVQPDARAKKALEALGYTAGNER
jgi:arylsulfatase